MSQVRSTSVYEGANLADSPKPRTQRKIGLFVPCYIDAFFPEVGIATLELLETAVRLKCNFVHLVCSDGAYNMVEIQELAKYGRSSTVKFWGS